MKRLSFHNSLGDQDLRSGLGLRAVKRSLQRSRTPESSLKMGRTGTPGVIDKFEFHISKPPYLSVLDVTRNAPNAAQL
jgi:hypothetical protein